LTATHIAALKGRAEIVVLLRDAAARINRRDRFGRTPLLLACQGKNPVTATVLIDINVADKKGKTPLRKAARQALEDVVSKLLDINSSSEVINAKDINNSTALHVAAYNGHSGVVKILLEKGADWKAEDINKKTPLDLCHEGWNVGDKSTSEDTMLLLIQKSTKAAAENPNMLCTAARKGSMRVLEALLGCGADVNGRDDHGWSAFATANQYAQHEAAEFLAVKGGEIRTQPTRWHKPHSMYTISDDGLRLEYGGGT
jgi:ankyrin repeat protein